MTLFRAFCIIVITALCAGPAAAQRIDSPYRFLDYGQSGGLFGGMISTSEGPIDIGPASGPVFGARWSMRVSGPFTAGAELAYLPTTRVVRDTVFVTADSAYRQIGEADMGILTGMAMLQFNVTGARTWHSLQPFVVLAAGAALDVAGSDAVEADLPSDARFDFGTSFAGQLGAGVGWFPAQRLSMRLDGRMVLWKLPVPEAFLLTPNGESLAGSEWAQNFALTAGVSFHF